VDSERAVVSKAFETGQLSTLLARGIESRHFSNTSSGQEVKDVFNWASKHSRKYGVCPSQQLVKSNFPNWRGEPSSDPLEALIDEFLNDVRRRYFAAKVIELAKAEGNPANWGRLDEIMLDAARDLATVVPSGQVARFGAEMEERIDQYEVEKDEGTSRGTKMGIELFDEITDGYRPGNLVTLAGYAGRGKSTIGLHFLSEALRQEKSGLLLPLEMSSQEVMERLDTMANKFSYRDLMKKSIPDEEIDSWRSMAKNYSSAKKDLIVSDKMGNCNIDRVYAEINRYKPDVTCVDYVQLMKGSKASMAKWEGLVEIANELKAIALATDSTIIMVSQDQRGSASDGSTESNMGGSIAILQAPDMYIGMMQDQVMYEENRMKMRLIKNRRGKHGAETDVAFEPEYMRIGPWNNNSSNFEKEVVAV
jgi:replicative DNA helicase